jgi:hypothetical protein
MPRLIPGINLNRVFRQWVIASGGYVYSRQSRGWTDASGVGTTIGPDCLYATKAEARLEIARKLRCPKAYREPWYMRKFKAAYPHPVMVNVRSDPMEIDTHVWRAATSRGFFNLIGTRGVVDGFIEGDRETEK